jgi:hypothetical protein
MDWDRYAESFKKKSRWGQWRDWNRMSPDEREYLISMYHLTPPPPPQGVLVRIGSWPASNILGLWIAEGVALLVCLVLTSQYTYGRGSHFDFPGALSWWLAFLVPGLVLTWAWVKARELRKEIVRVPNRVIPKAQKRPVHIQSV